MKKQAMSLGELKQKNLRAQIQYRVATSFFLPTSKQIAFPFLLYVKKKPLILILGPTSANGLFS